MTYDANELNSKHLTFFRFEDLKLTHKPLVFTLWVQKMNHQFPEPADNALAAPFCESARQIALRIAEGSAREKVQFILYLKEAKSAIRSCLVYTTIAYKHGYIIDVEEDESRNQLMEMTKMLGALITSLQKGSNAQHDQLDEDLFPSKNW